MGGRPPDDARVDDVRERLKALGYLDAGVDRFVLGSAGRTQSAARMALSASVRIGCVAAVLLGPSAAIGLVNRAPALVRGPRDAVVAAVYLGVLFGVGVAAASCAAALLAFWAARKAPGGRFVSRARRASAAAGVSITTACLAYLTLWWGASGAAPAWSSPWRTACALAIAAAISIVLGHAVAITAGALTMALPDRATPPGARDLEIAGLQAGHSTSWRRTVAMSTATFGAAALLLLISARDYESSAGGAALSVRRSGPPVTVIAIDGFDPGLEARGDSEPRESPDPLDAVQGARADLAASDTTDPARLWTTIATGVREDTHGVVSLETRRVTGLRGRLASGSLGRVLGAATDAIRLTTPAVASGFERRVRTFWEVAEAAGLRTAVVNWWATWPADPSGGRVLSDRALLRLERGGPLDAELAPEELYEQLRGEWSRLRATARALAAAQFSTPGAALGRRTSDVLIRSAELDATVVQLGRAVSGSNTDLLVIYLPGLDIAQHTLLADEAPSAPSELALRVAALERYYRFLGELLRDEIAAGRRGERRVFVVAQPGRREGGHGVMTAIGEGFRKAARVSARIVDVAPTVLHTLGVPVARDLDGRPLGDLFDAESLEKHSVRMVDTYGRRGAVTAARGGAPLDQEMIDRLRSLGYVK